MFSLTAFLASLAQYLTAALIVLALLALAMFVAFNSQRIACWMVGFGGLVPRFNNEGPNRSKPSFASTPAASPDRPSYLCCWSIWRLFVDSAQIILIIGLFSAAFGLGACGLVAGIPVATPPISFATPFDRREGGVRCRRQQGGRRGGGCQPACHAVAPATTGELFTVPNGEITIIRNFSRSIYSGTLIKLSIPTSQLSVALETLRELGQRVPQLVPELNEPWQLLITNEDVGATTEVTLVARFAFGKAAPLKAQLVAAIDAELAQAGCV